MGTTNQGRRRCVCFWHSWIDCAPGEGNYAQKGREKGGGNREQGGREKGVGKREQGTGWKRASFISKLRGIGVFLRKIDAKTHGEMMHLRLNGAEDIIRVVILVGGKAGGAREAGGR